MEQAVALLGEVAQELRPMLEQGVWPAELFRFSPKIAKGEKYQGLPYVILDYPRVFGKTDIFAVRTLFWWGHFFSVTLHLRGQYKTQYAPVLMQRLSLLRQYDFYISVGEDEWQHDFSTENYRALTAMEDTAIERILMAGEFCKLSSRIALEQWDQSVVLLTGLLRVVFQSLSD
ncbi:MAG: hypothetical protein P0Y53_01810 [Candidatus Pseudobacter hemicellulosilyticus]|uniref:Uncharacterized protein n=1 Tax=Candidatus Pseudobacter hemicellulosilyticus TaxID=3121375 RepID=A0AAJ5WT69_9BACT|nr:MAG: hypothetical protein P0Y53_01810 [Pseudobacter sp.]